VVVPVVELAVAREEPVVAVVDDVELLDDRELLAVVELAEVLDDELWVLPPIVDAVVEEVAPPIVVEVDVVAPEAGPEANGPAPAKVASAAAPEVRATNQALLRRAAGGPNIAVLPVRLSRRSATAGPWPGARRSPKMPPQVTPLR
jgi:hypothetical protein